MQFPEHADDDENALMFARIDHERTEREGLENQRQELLKRKQKLIADNKRRKDDLANLDNDLEKFIDVRVSRGVLLTLANAHPGGEADPNAVRERGLSGLTGRLLSLDTSLRDTKSRPLSRSTIYLRLGWLLTVIRIERRPRVESYARAIPCGQPNYSSKAHSLSVTCRHSYYCYGDFHLL